MPASKTLTQHFTDHVAELEMRATSGDSFAAKSLGALALLAEGWRPGDDDPDDGGDDPDQGEPGDVIDLAVWRDRLAA